VRTTSASKAESAYGIQKTEPLAVIRVRYGVVACLGLATPFVFPPHWRLAALFLASYLVRIFAMEGIYHRYFAHRAYKASRWGQFLLGLIGTQSGQRGPLFWASCHRVHHQTVDTNDDPHSPVAKSVAFSHAGWLLSPAYIDTDLDRVPDLARFPELVWLNKYHWICLYAGAFGLFLAGHYGLFGIQISDWAAVFWGFFLPIALALQTTSLVNSVGHLKRLPGGYRRFDTPDGSTNRPLLALVTVGAGWHNNHHRYAATARAGFAWYEIDIAYYVIKAMAALRLITDVRSKLPEDVRKEGQLP